MTPAEALTTSFYAWELRGRGWTLADYPVSLEPPYRPCFLLPGLQTAPHMIDDGKRPTFLSSLIDRARTLLVEAPASSPSPPSFEEALPFPEFLRDPQTALVIRLPDDYDTSIEASQRMLRAFLASFEPVSFEMIGHQGTVSIQVVCSQSDAEQISEAISGYAPEVAVAPGDDLLARTWHDDAHHLVIDFGLAQEFFLPLGTPRSFRFDPYISLVAALARARQGETLCFQVLMERTMNPWSKAILDAVTDGTGGSIIADAPEFVSMSREKVSSPLASVAVRIGAQAQSPERAWELSRGTGSFILQHARPGGNELVPLENDGYPDELHVAAFMERRSFRTGMILSLDELTGLVHIPDASVRHEGLVREHRQTKGLPADALGHALILGTNIHRGEQTPATLSPERRLEHVHIVGASGTGKSTLLVNLITQDLAAGNGLALFDPHGDLVDDVLARIPQELTDQVVVFDPGDAEYPIGFNVLSAQNEVERNLIASDLVGVFQRLSTSWGDAMSTVLGNAVLAILEHPEGGTLLTLRQFLVDDAFRRQYLKNVADREVRFFWEKEFQLIGTRSIGPILTRLNTFLRPKLIRNIVAQTKPRLDLAEIMNTGKVFLAKLSQGIMGEENAYLLGSLLVTKFHQLALSRQTISKEQRRPFYLYADEFQHWVTPSMASLLTEARKYGVGLVLAHQILAQLRDSPRVQDAVMGNAYTRIVFRVGDDDARKLADGFSSFTAGDIQRLGRGEAIVRMGTSTQDFNMRITPAAAVSSDGAILWRSKVVHASRTLYATPISEVPEIYIEARETVPEGKRPDEQSPIRQSIEQVAIAEPALDVEAVPTKPTETLAASKPRRLHVADAESTPMGRGGREHVYLQQLIKRLGEERGFRAIIEADASDGKADVLLKKGPLTIACEISISTSVEHEVENLKKCLCAGFTRVFFICSNKRRRDTVAKRIKEVATQTPIDFLSPEEICAALDSTVCAGSPAESTVRGYKVKVTRQSVSLSDVAERRSAVAGVIARSLRQTK